MPPFHSDLSRRAFLGASMAAGAAAWLPGEAFAGRPTAWPHLDRLAIEYVASGKLPGLVAYCTSKAATAMLGKALAREWIRKGVNVNVLCPGYIKTELNSDWFDSEGGQKLVAGFPRRRLMEEDDLSATALYLCSDAARAVTGSVFTVDDGQSL